LDEFWLRQLYPKLHFPPRETHIDKFYCSLGICGFNLPFRNKMDPNYESPSVASESTLNATASSLQRLDDKLATGMSISDVAMVRWLTDVEVLQYLDLAFGDTAEGEVIMPRSIPKLSIFTGPPSTPPTTGTLLLYKVAETPNYADDGIEWIQEKGVASWVDIAGVLTGELPLLDSSESSKGSTQKAQSAAFIGTSKGGSSKSSSAMGVGATVQYLTSVKSPTFHRREYRGPNDIVLIQYLDSVRALRMTAELVDKLVELSTGSQPSKAAHADSKTSGIEAETFVTSKQHRGKKLDDTLNILYGMVNEHDAIGTSTNEANDEKILNPTNRAAIKSLMKHVSSDEAASIVDAMDIALDEDLLLGGEGFEDVNDVTEVDISEAIDQVLCEGGGVDNEGGVELEAFLEDVAKETKGAAAIIEDRILSSMEGVIPEELRIKLIKTTEVLMNVAGVNFSNEKGEMAGKDMDSASVGSGTGSAAGSATGSIRTASTTYEAGLPLPEIIDITPSFHIAGYQPPKPPGDSNTHHVHSMVISTESSVPDLPPYVDNHSTWVMFACFVDFLEMSRDVTVRSISFEKLTQLTPYSYKCPIPADINESSSLHIIVVGVLLPKDYRHKVSMIGIELALKLSIQAEWAAAADIVLALKRSKVIEDIRPFVSGLRRPLLVVPCGGTRMQLLSQISKTEFTLYPNFNRGSSTSKGISSSLNSKRTVASQDRKRTASEQSSDEKKKRDEYMQEWATVPCNDPTMTSDEVDRHRKIRFVERMTNAITGANEISNDGAFDGSTVDSMSDEEIDNLLGEVLMRFVEISIESSTDSDKLRDEINYCGYSGLALLHHAAFYNYAGLVALLLSHNANPDVVSSAGKLTPLHFAAFAGHKDIVHLLLRNGCNPVSIDADNLTPADHAIRAGYPELARDLDAHIQQSGVSKPNVTPPGAFSATSIDIVLQSAFKELSLKDKLGLNLFVNRTMSSGDDSANVPMQSVHGGTDTAPPESEMMTDVDDGLENFAFISEEDRIKLRAAMSLANEMDLDEMNRVARHQDVCRFLRQSNYEAIKAASKALEKSKKKESDILKSLKNPEDPSKLQLSRALAMLVLRKNLPSSS